MSKLSRKQARVIQLEISKLYGRNYIPLITGDSTLSIGDILESKRDISPVIDSSDFSAAGTKFSEGRKENKNITSSVGINMTIKLKGEAVLSEHFKLDEAGIAVNFTSSNQMFLKVQGIRQQSIKNFVTFRNELLKKYTKGEISSKVYVVRGLVYADKFYLQYSGKKGGTIGFNIKADLSAVEAETQADFSLKWKKEVGYNVDGLNGGVLAYRVSGVRLKRHLLPGSVHKNILKGMSEADAMDTIAFNDRVKLLNNDALEIVDLTDEVLLAQGEDIA